MKKHRYSTIQEWQERTGTPTTRLADMARIDRSHLQKILTRSRRCSYEKALRLSMVTGVPVENLVRWMAEDSQSRTERPFKQTA